MVSISGSTPPPPPPRQSSQETSLTEEQSTLISDTLSEYNVDNLSEADAQAIVDTFAEAGLTPGKEFADAIASAGFDAKEIGDLAGVGQSQDQSAGPPPPPPQSEGQGFTDEMLTTLETLLSEYEGQGLDSDTIDSITSTMEDLFGLDKTGRLLDVNA
jgi:hypothetical protein